jgi:hypothetical protein
LTANPTRNPEALMKSILISTAIILFIGLGGSLVYRALAHADPHSAANGWQIGRAAQAMMRPV